MTGLICSHAGCGKPLTVYVEDVTSVRKIISQTDANLDIEGHYEVAGDGDNPRLQCEDGHANAIPEEWLLDFL